MKTTASSLEVVLEYVRLLRKFCKCHGAFSPLWVSSCPFHLVTLSHVDEDEPACTAAPVPVRRLILGPADLI